MWNGSRHLEAYHATAGMGAVLHTLNVRLSETDLEYIINHAGDRLIIADADVLPLLEKLNGRIPTVERIVVASEAGFEGWSTSLPDAVDYEEFIQGKPAHFEWPEIGENSPLGLCYTSGTTGLPKGAVISHRAQIARNLVLRNEFGLKPDDTFVCWTPLYHMGGADHALGTLMVGGKVIVHDGFNADLLAEAAADEPIGWLVVMPGTAEQVIDAIKRVNRPIRNVRVCGVMADLIPRHQILELTALLDAPFVNTFGSTETGSPPASASLLPVGSLPEKLSKQQSRYCEVRLVDGDDREVGVGVPGELLIRGPTLFSGYWANRDANLESFRDGWFHMGDVFVRYPDTSLDFVDRAKYMIKC